MVIGGFSFLLSKVETNIQVLLSACTVERGGEHWTPPSPPSTVFLSSQVEVLHRDPPVLSTGSDSLESHSSSKLQVKLALWSAVDSSWLI